MADISGLTPGQTVSFELHTRVLANEFQNVTYLGEVNYEIASTFDDLDATHANIYSTLPEGIPDDPRMYNYILVKLASGSRKPIGIPWIKDPVKIITSSVITIVVKDASANDTAVIKRALNAYGFTDIVITVN